MGDTSAARRFEEQVTAMRAGGKTPTGDATRAAGGRLEIAARLLALQPDWERHALMHLRTTVARAVEDQRHQSMPARAGQTWWPAWRMAAGVIVAGALLVALVPGAPALLARPLVRILQIVHVGDHTAISRNEPRTADENAAGVRELQAGVASGQRWFVHTDHYGAFGGSVPSGESAAVTRIEDLGQLQAAATMAVQVPTIDYRGDRPAFDHALVAPGGLLLLFFGSGQAELLLVEAPVGDGRAMAYSRSVGTSDAGGGITSESPELQTETFVLDGQTVVWDPDTTGLLPNTTALRWEADGVSYALMGRSLRRQEAENVFLSLRPLPR